MNANRRFFSSAETTKESGEPLSFSCFGGFFRLDFFGAAAEVEA